MKNPAVPSMLLGVLLGLEVFLAVTFGTALIWGFVTATVVFTVIVLIDYGRSLR